MTTPASPDHAEPWYLLGAGNMGLLAAHYLQRAGFTVIALRRDDAGNLLIDLPRAQIGEDVEEAEQSVPQSVLIAPAPTSLVSATPAPRPPRCASTRWRSSCARGPSM